MRKLILILLALGLLAAAGYGARRGYRMWKEHHAIKQAREAVAKGEFNQALLWLRKTLSANGNNREAVRLMGDFAELTQSPNAVLWRNRLVELDPDSITNRLLLARSAIVHREFATAQKALDGMPDAGKQSPEFHKVTGALMTATGRFLEAEKHFQNASTLEPQNPVPRLNLAMIMIQRTNQQLAAQGRLMLEGLCTNDRVRTDALRHLTLDAMRHTNHTRALSLVGDLVGDTNALFTDRLLQLDVQRAARNPQLPSTLAALEQHSATNAARVFELSRWMLAGTTPGTVLDWLQTLAPEIRTNIPVTMVVADAYLASTNWVGLHAWVSRQRWGEFEYLRLAFSARALREQKLATAAQADWSKVMEAAEGRLDRLAALQRLTVAWKWVIELEEVLWAIVNRFPSEQPAVQSLLNLLHATGQTRPLLNLCVQMNRSDPKNDAFKNNLAVLALLLDAREHDPHRLAREVYQSQGDNPHFVSTYAYSLHLQKKTREALELMAKLKPEDLEQPTISGYYGLLLAAAGDQAKAKKYLELAGKGRLLPEETKLFRGVTL